MKNLPGFKKLYSAIVKDHFLGTWISDDKQHQITEALRGGGYHVVPLSRDASDKFMQRSDTTMFYNIATLEEAVSIYEKYLK